MRLAVVRHGEAVAKEPWTGADVDRPLTDKGRRQAVALIGLVGAAPDRLLTSPARRCRQTVEPLGRHWARGLEVSDALARDAGLVAADLIHDVVSATSDHSTIVVCTHREVIVEVLPLLAKEGGVRLGHRLPGATGAVWFVDYRAGRLDTVRYLASRA